MTDISEIADLREKFANCNTVGDGSFYLLEQIDRLMTAIHFSSTAESIKPENAEKTRAAFLTFLENCHLHLSVKSLDVLLTEEKKGEYAFRKDGVTPNWYHEFREILMFLSLVRSGVLPLNEVEDWGGIDGTIAGLLRHDSLEDFGKTEDEISTALHEHIEDLYASHQIDLGTHQNLNHNICKAIDIIDRMSRKTSILDDNGRPLTQQGKFIRKDRFGGDLNIYFQRLHQNPLAGIAKYMDSIEGMSTRVGVDAFDTLKDFLYAAERRHFFGGIATDRALIGNFPAFKEAVKSADFMLGITLVIMETLNYYKMHETAHPESAFPMDIERYMPRGLEAFRFIPPAFRPDCIMIERLRDAAATKEKEGDMRLTQLLENAILPALTPYRKYFPERLLPNNIVSGDIGPWPMHLSTLSP